MDKPTTANQLKLNLDPRPFLKWAGGKRWLAPTVKANIDLSNFKKYHELFLGGGSVFFELKPQEAIISDANHQLINTYNSVKEDIENVISDLSILKNSKEDYYRIRGHKFSRETEKAAQFIYLNQLSFNGIYRVNLKGEFNVPYGNREKYKFDYNNLRVVSSNLQSVDIKSGDFFNGIDNISKGDLVFLDPPYTITHNHNGFIKYNEKIFSIEDQYRLSVLIDNIKAKGAFYILTNAAHAKVKEIFDKGDRLMEVGRMSMIGGKNAKRGVYSELIITNISKPWHF